MGRASDLALEDIRIAHPRVGVLPHVSFKLLLFLRGHLAQISAGFPDLPKSIVHVLLECGRPAESVQTHRGILGIAEEVHERAP